MNPDANGRDGRGPVAVRVMHASPGRLRVKVDRESFDSDELRNAEQALSEVAGVLEVRRNPTARSVLIRYDPSRASLPAMFAAVTRAGVTITVPSQEPAAPTADAPALNTMISGVFKRADDWVAEQSGHRADLRTLVPIGLGALAVREVLAGRVAAAPWYVLAWYAFDSFQKLRRPDSGSTPPQQD